MFENVVIRSKAETSLLDFLEAHEFFVEKIFE